MSGERIDRRRLAMVLVDAHFLGVPRTAKKWAITDRTIQNYRTRMVTDQELARLYLERRTRSEAEWHDERMRFLKSALDKLDELVALADSAKDITAIANAVKVVGELQVAEDVLSGGHRPDPARPVAPAPAGDTEPSVDEAQPDRH